MMGGFSPFKDNKDDVKILIEPMEEIDEN